MVLPGKFIYIISFFLVLCFFFLQNNVSAQASGLSLDEAIELALQHNLSLQKLELDLTASGYSEKNLWAEIFPAINASASIGYRTNLFSDIQLNNAGQFYNIGFGINLGLNAGIPFLIKNIKWAHEGNILRYEDARNQIAIQVTKIYIALVAEKNNLILLEEVFNLAQRQFLRSETLFRNGHVGELSLTQSRLALENARYSLSAARIAHENNISEFLAMLGLTEISGSDADESITLSGDVKIVRIEADAETLIKNHLHLRPDIIRINQEIERLKNSQTQIFLQNRAPSLSLSVDWSSSSFDPFTDTLSATARVNIPIDSWIPGTSREQIISRSGDSLEKAKMDLVIAENAAKTQIRSLTAMLKNSWESIRIARLSLEAAQRGYQLSEQGFLNGTVEALSLGDSRNNMANARQRLLQTELSYFNMILDLSAALNTDWKIFIQTFGVPGE